MHYDLTIITTQAGMHPKALDGLAGALTKEDDLLACWYTDIGALNKIMLLRNAADPKAARARREAVLNSTSPFGLGDVAVSVSMDTYVAFDFLPPIKAGAIGPCFEVRSYELKPGGLPPTLALWRKAIPERSKVSPVLTAMSAVTGVATRFIHIWPYKSMEERGRLRAKAIADGVWPPPGGVAHIATQQTDIYLPAPFSPLR